MCLSSFMIQSQIRSQMCFELPHSTAMPTAIPIAIQRYAEDHWGTKGFKQEPKKFYSCFWIHVTDLVFRGVASRWQIRGVFYHKGVPCAASGETCISDFPSGNYGHWVPEQLWTSSVSGRGVACPFFSNATSAWVYGGVPLRCIALLIFFWSFAHLSLLKTTITITFAHLGQDDRTCYTSCTSFMLFLPFA